MEIFLVKCLIVASTVLIFIQTSCGTVPKRCYKSSTSAHCYPHIPSFLNIYGWDLSGVTTFLLYSSSSVWALQTLPDDIFEMASDLKNVYLNNAGLEKLPCEVFKPFQKSLERIYLNVNMFEEFPVCALKNFEALEYVQLENQQLKCFQADTLSWNSIQSIYLRNNKLTMFNISNIDNQNEVSVYLDNNKISILQMFDTNHIRYLSAKNNLIRHVNVNIFQTSKTTLEYLDLSHNKLVNSIWDALADVSSLQTLKLNNNQISVASSSVLNSASNLVYLDLSNNQLTTLAAVAFRSGKLTNLLLGSNRLTEIPPFLTSSTATFDSNPQQYDLSNNSIGKISISIPSDASYLTVRLDRNKLREVTFDSNKIKIRTLNISHNDIHFLPYLPKANTYVLSYNPLDTDNVIQKLTNEMLEASAIELENVGLFCDKNVFLLPTINSSGLGSLNLRHNCIPLDIICHINTSCLTCLSLYLDSNIATPLSCSLRDKRFYVLSVNECGLNNTVMNHFFGDHKPKYFEISARQNDATLIPLIQKTLDRSFDFSCDLSNNQIKKFEGFNISSNQINLNLENNEISSIKQGKMWSSHSHIYLTLKFANNSLIDVNDGVVSIFSLNYFTISFIIDVSYNSIEEIKFRNFIQFQTQPLASYSSLNINVSHNNIQSIEDCLQLDMRLTLDLSFNNITTLPNMSCGMADKIYLGYNKIQGIASLLPSARTQVLDLQWNRITEIHYNAFDNLTYLRELNLRGNRIEHIPPSVQALTSLKVLDISFNRIRQVFTPIPGARTQILDLQWNMITEIHLNAFDNLTYLNELNLRGNRIDIVPSSIKTLRSLKILDISFNRIRHISQSYFKDLELLQKLIITDNSFFIPVNVLQINKLYHFEANKIHCDCDMMFLRNLSFSPQFKVTGRCTTPSEYEGYHVSCFPVNQCIGVVPLYITKTTIETCQNDRFSEISINTTETENMLIINIKIIGQRKPRSTSMKAYSKSKLIKEVELIIADRIIAFWLHRNLKPDNVCFSSVFHDNETVSRCFAVNIKSKYTSDKMDDDNGVLYGISSLLAISLFVNISVGFFTLTTYRNKHKKDDTQYPRDDNNTESYEIPSASNVGSSSQSVYDDIPDLEGNDREHSYSNLALDM